MAQNNHLHRYTDSHLITVESTYGHGYSKQPSLGQARYYTNAV